MRQKLLGILFGIVCVFMVSCDKTEITAIYFTKDAITMEVGDVEILEWKVKFKGSIDIYHNHVILRSTNRGIVRIRELEQNGEPWGGNSGRTMVCELTAIEPGETDITVLSKYGGKTASCHVTVVEK